MCPWLVGDLGGSRDSKFGAILRDHRIYFGSLLGCLEDLLRGPITGGLWLGVGAIYGDAKWAYKVY